MQDNDYGGLVLTRMQGQVIFIGTNIRVTVGKIEKGKVQLHITAPKSMGIYREEVIFANDFTRKMVGE
jgi:carbon storage regulator CsrA